METDLVYRVLGKPGVSVVKPSYGFPGASIVFEGQEFGYGNITVELDKHADVEVVRFEASTIIRHNPRAGKAFSLMITE